MSFAMRSYSVGHGDADCLPIRVWRGFCVAGNVDVDGRSQGGVHDC